MERIKFWFNGRAMTLYALIGADNEYLPEGWSNIHALNNVTLFISDEVVFTSATSASWSYKLNLTFQDKFEIYSKLKEAAKKTTDAKTASVSAGVYGGGSVSPSVLSVGGGLF